MDLKELFGDKTLTYDDFQKAVDGKKLKLADLSSGDYVDKHKLDDKIDELKKANETIQGLQDTVKKFDGVDVDVLKKPVTVVSPVKEGKKVRYLVIYKYLEDAHAAGYLADYLHCPVAQWEKQLDADTLAAVETVFQVGGTAINSSVKLISGTTAVDTARKVLDLIK